MKLEVGVTSYGPCYVEHVEQLHDTIMTQGETAYDDGSMCATVAGWLVRGISPTV